MEQNNKENEKAETSPAAASEFLRREQEIKNQEKNWSFLCKKNCRWKEKNFCRDQKTGRAKKAAEQNSNCEKEMEENWETQRKRAEEIKRKANRDLCSCRGMCRSLALGGMLKLPFF